MLWLSLSIMHTQMVQQNFVMDCSNVVGGVVVQGLPVTVGLFHTTYIIFKFRDGHENFLPYGKHTTMCNNINQHHDITKNSSTDNSDDLLYVTL